MQVDTVKGNEDAASPAPLGPAAADTHTQFKFTVTIVIMVHPFYAVHFVPNQV